MRERSKRADLAVYGPNFPRMTVLDVHMVSTLTATCMKDWEKRKSWKEKKTVLPHILKAEGFKRSHYARAMREMFPGEKIDIAKPLMQMGMDFVPFVVLPWGVIGPEADKFLRQLAQQAVEAEIDATPPAHRLCNNTTDSRGKVRVNQLHTRFRHIIITSLVHAVATTSAERPYVSFK